MPKREHTKWYTKMRRMKHYDWTTKIFILKMPVSNLCALNFGFFILKIRAPRLCEAKPEARLGQRLGSAKD
jgi:hypothetical protein